MDGNIDGMMSMIKNMKAVMDETYKDAFDACRESNKALSNPDMGEKLNAILLVQRKQLEIQMKTALMTQSMFGDMEDITLKMKSIQDEFNDDYGNNDDS